MTVHPWAELLALREAAGCQIHVFAGHLRRHPLGGQVHTPLPTPKPTAAHRHLADRQMAALLRLDLTLIPIWQLPPYLASVSPMPVALFVRGAPDLVHKRPATGIVGARKAGPRGCRWAQDLALALAAQGQLIVSGGALGVDSAAHHGALAAGAPTVVYMGTAIDRAYPRQNVPLFERVLRGGGALISEHPPYGRTFKSSHALRNRFIAAHGSALVVVEAAVASGTLGAVNYARRLGRQIYVSPARVGGERMGLDSIVSQGWATMWPEPAG